jgi:hypothetical protein
VKLKTADMAVGKKPWNMQEAQMTEGDRRGRQVAHHKHAKRWCVEKAAA